MFDIKEMCLQNAQAMHVFAGEIAAMAKTHDFHELEGKIITLQARLSTMRVIVRAEREAGRIN